MYETEKRLIRRAGWLLPISGFAAAAMLGSWLWALVEQTHPLPPLSWKAALRFPFVGILAGSLALLAAWRILMIFDERLRVRHTRFPWAVVFGLLLVAGAEVCFRLPQVQLPFWLAVRVRNPGSADFFARELALLRVDALSDRSVAHESGVVFAGTSQLMIGIDYDRLRRELPETVVRRRSMAGMAPLRMVMARPWLGIGQNDLVVLYLSSFDMTGVGGIGADWLRPTANVAGMRDWFAALPPGAVRENWRSVTDVTMASLFELWATRDHWRAFVFGKPPAQTSDGTVSQDRVVADQLAQFQRGREQDPYFESGFRALGILLSRFTQDGARVLIFEGQVNPAFRTDISRHLDEVTRSRIEALAKIHGAQYIPISDQHVSIGPNDWRDGTHLNEAGREKFTQYVADVLRSPIP